MISSTSEQLGTAIRSAIQETDNLILDFKGIEYIASAGLRILLEAKKLLDAQNGKFTIRNVKDDVMHVFDITGFSDILNIE